MQVGTLPPEGLVQRARKPFSTKRLTTISLVVALGFCAICGKVLWDVRQAAGAQASQAMTNLIAAVGSDVERNVELYDLSLQAVVDGLKLPEINSIDPNIRQLVLFDRAATAKYMGAIRVLDEEGNIVLDSRSLHPGTENLSDRDYFVAHQRTRDLGVYISGLQVDSSAEYVIGISRHISKPDGAFAGVVVGTLRLAYFQDLFQRMSLGRGGTMTLFRTDGTVLTRFPFNSSDIGRDMRDAEVFRQFAKTSRGSFENSSMIDGVARLFTYGQVGDLPLIVVVGLSMDDIYASWRREALVIGLMMLALCGATVALALSLRRELTRRMAAERELAVMARTDSLTGLPNRRYFDEVIEREWQRATRNQSAIALLMIDADWFKAYNDSHGHQAGDKLLAMIAACVSKNVRRPGDLSVRYGGEEFAALLPGTDLAGAVDVADGIRASVSALNIPHPTSASGFQTVSVGVASVIPCPGEHHRALVAAADMALYRAKNNGRNRTELAHMATAGVPAQSDSAARARRVA